MQLVAIDIIYQEKILYILVDGQPGLMVLERTFADVL
jgi:hypothetical protein